MRDGPKTRRGRLLLLVPAAALVTGVVALAGLWEFSSSPQFCNSCHIMRPYVAAWKVSKHNAVPCVQCHYPPGFRDTLWVKYQAISQVAKWATQTYSSKPFAEVEDASCLRSGCHSRARLETAGTLISTQGIMFNHGPHRDRAKVGTQLRCSSCHSQIVVERHFEVSRSTCFLCHFKGMKTGRELTPIAGCTGCHQAPKGDILVNSIRFNHEEIVRRGVGCQKCHLNVIEGEGEAPRERCFTCHNQPEKLRRYPDTPFIHDFHVTGHNIDCARCHTEIKHKLPPPIGAPSVRRAPDSLARTHLAAGPPGR